MRQYIAHLFGPECAYPALAAASVAACIRDYEQRRNTPRSDKGSEER
jgi:hypothetical protein